MLPKSPLIFVKAVTLSYRLEFESQPLQFVQPKRNPLSDFNTALIAAEVDKLLSKGAIVKISHVEGEFISALFLVPEKTGDLRPVINLKPLNTFMRKLHFKMESIDHDFVKHLLKLREYIATIDLKDAFFSVPSHTHDHKYLGFKKENSEDEFSCPIWV